MATLVKRQEPTADERKELEQLARSRTEEARLVQQAQIVPGLAAGDRSYLVADRVGSGGRPHTSGSTGSMPRGSTG